jgi:hypothetical protein
LRLTPVEEPSRPTIVLVVQAVVEVFSFKASYVGVGWAALHEDTSWKYDRNLRGFDMVMRKEYKQIHD